MAVLVLLPLLAVPHLPLVVPLLPLVVLLLPLVVLLLPLVVLPLLMLPLLLPAPFPPWLVLRALLLVAAPLPPVLLLAELAPAPQGSRCCRRRRRLGHPQQAPGEPAGRCAAQRSQHPCPPHSPPSRAAPWWCGTIRWGRAGGGEQDGHLAVTPGPLQANWVQ